MKMKQAWLVAVAGAFMAGGASAALVESWQFNEAAGTNLSGLANDVGLATWSGSVPNALTDGSGNLHFTQGSTATDNLFRNSLLTQTNVVSGIYELAFSFSAATMSSGDSAGANVGFGVRDDAAVAVDLFLVRIHKQSGTLRLQTRINNVNTDIVNFGATSLPDVLNVRARFNLDTDLMDLYYQVGAAPEVQVSGIAILDGQMDQVRMAANLNNADFGATDFVDVNYLTLAQIPEPATMGMIAVFGSAILFIRRRFMI